MEALAAVGLVNNIFGFIDFGMKVISKFTELYRSTEGALAENLDLEAAANHLITLERKLMVDVAVETTDTELVRLCKSSQSVATELLAALSKVKAEGKADKWKSMSKALRSVRSKDKIEGLAERLSRIRNELSFHLLVHFRDQVSQFKCEHLQSFKSLHANTQALVEAAIQQLHESQVAHNTQVYLIKSSHGDTISKIEEEHTKTRGTILQTGWPTEGPQPSLVIAPYWYVPFARTQPLIGRDAELSDIEKKLFRADYFSKVAITGLGGVGKTRVALEIAYRAKEKYPKCSVFWIVATSLASIQQSYVNIRQQMHIPGEESKEGNTQRLVQHHLSQGIVGQWLLIIDNADDSDMWFKDVDVNSGLRPLDYLPSSSDGSILVTTRNRKAASKFAGGNVVSLSELDAVTAENVLRTSLVNKEILHDHDVTLRLLEQLAFLPLAIIQAAAYINANDISLWDYLSLLDSTETDIIEVLSEDFEDEIRYRDLNNAVATTWLVSFENILRQDPTAADFLCFMSCIEPKNIPQYLLPPVLSKKQAVDAIGTLTAYAFVSKRSGSQSFDLHRLVHLSTRNWLRSSQSLADWTAKTAARLAKVFPYLSDDEQDVHQKYHGSRALLPHVQKLCSSDLFQSNVLNNQRLIATAADCLLSDASSTTFIQISRMISDGKDIIRDLRGGNHRETLQIMRIRTIIQALSLQGRWEEDHTWIMEAITILERVREKRRPVWLKLYMKITLMKLSVGEGCRKEPGDLFMEEIECEKELRGKDDPIILTAMRILGDYFCAHNRFDAAVKLQTEVLATRKKLLGEGHPASLTTLYSLASTMDEQGRCKEAGTLHEKALAMRRKTLGDDHPHTFLSMTSLAYIYIHEHEHEKASDLGREICKGILRRKGGKELAEWLPLLSALEEKKLETVVTKMRDK